MTVYIRKNANLYEKGDFIGHMKNKTVISKTPDGRLSHICEKLTMEVPKESVKLFKEFYGNRLNLLDKVRLKLIDMYNTVVNLANSFLNRIKSVKHERPSEKSSQDNKYLGIGNQLIPGSTWSSSGEDNDETEEVWGNLLKASR